MTTDQTDAYTAALARERAGYDHRLAVATEALDALGDPADEEPEATRIARVRAQAEVERATARATGVDEAIDRLKIRGAKRPRGGASKR